MNILYLITMGAELLSDLRYESNYRPRVRRVFEAIAIEDEPKGLVGNFSAPEQKLDDHALRTG
jgi:hypothetical protein